MSNYKMWKTKKKQSKKLSKKQIKKRVNESTAYIKDLLSKAGISVEDITEQHNEVRKQ